jgi:hypothetical protein
MTIGDLIKSLQKYPPETPCSYDLWVPDDVRAAAADYLPAEGEEGAITDEEIAETLATVFRRRDASIGTTWQTLVDCMPGSVQDRM